MAKVIVSKITEEEFQKKGIKRWSIWEKEISKFDWNYEDTEECYIISGEATIETMSGNIEIKAGDFVVFQENMKCVWDVKQPIKKYYRFK